MGNKSKKRLAGPDYVLKWFGAKEAEAKRPCDEFVKKGIDQPDKTRKEQFSILERLQKAVR